MSSSARNVLPLRPTSRSCDQVVVEDIVAAACRCESFTVVRMGRSQSAMADPSFAHALATARFALAEGRKAAFQRAAVTASLSEVQLVTRIAHAAAANSVAIYLLGTSGDVLARAGRDLADRNDGRLDIAGSGLVPDGFDPYGPAADAALAHIEASGALLCLIGLETPHQELFAARAVGMGVPLGFVCVGEGLHDLVGASLRAPAVIQAAGLARLWRQGARIWNRGLGHARAWALGAR